MGALRATARVAGSSRRSTLARNALVATQVAIAMIVLMAAGAFVDSLLRAARVRPGFETERLVFVHQDFSLKRYKPDTAVQFSEREIAMLQADGTIAAATMSTKSALATSRTPVTLSRDAGDAVAPQVTAETDAIAANFFDVLGIRLLAGRPFDAHDRRDTPRVAIINHAMARLLWPNDATSTAIGRSIWLRRPSPRAAEPCEIIAIAEDTRYHSLWEERPRLFFPLQQSESFPNALILRTRATTESTTAAIERAITALDPQLPPPVIQDWPQTRETALVQQRLGLTLFATVAVAMLLLTTVGLYSVTASRVTQRRQEIALRIALGAAPQTVRARILLTAIAIATCGLVPGVMLGLTATTLVARVLPGLQPSPAVMTAAIAAALIALSAAATLVPAQRAASTDPMRVLRDQ